MNLLYITIASVAVNIALMAYFIYEGHSAFKVAEKRLKRIKEISDKNQKAGKPIQTFYGIMRDTIEKLEHQERSFDNRTMFDVYRDIVAATCCGYESFFFFLAAVYSKRQADIEDFRNFASIGIPIFQWYSDVKDIPPVTPDSIESVFRKSTGPGEEFYNMRLQPNLFVHQLEAEFLNQYEDFLISTGILDVPKSDADGEKGKRVNGS